MLSLCFHFAVLRSTEGGAASIGSGVSDLRPESSMDNAGVHRECQSTVIQSRCICVVCDGVRPQSKQ